MNLEANWMTIRWCPPSMTFLRCQMQWDAALSIALATSEFWSPSRSWPSRSSASLIRPASWYLSLVIFIKGILRHRPPSASILDLSVHLMKKVKHQSDLGDGPLYSSWGLWLGSSVFSCRLIPHRGVDVFLIISCTQDQSKLDVQALVDWHISQGSRLRGLSALISFTSQAANLQEQLQKWRKGSRPHS